MPSLRNAALLGLVAFAGARSSLAAPPIPNTDTFVYAMAGDIDTLDPHWQYDWVSNTAILQVYEPLVFFDGTDVSKLVPLLSEKVPGKGNGLISPDGLSYTFPIRKGVVFHDGTPLTPEDVRYSLMRLLLLDRTGGPSAMLLDPVLGVFSTRDKEGKVRPGLWKAATRAVQVHDGSVVLRLQKPFQPLLQILAGFGIVSKSWTAADGGWDGSERTWEKYNNPAKQDTPLYERANGTGPFVLDRWDRKERQLVLGRNERYWRGPARLKHLVFKTIGEFGTRKLLLQAGDVDAAFIERQYLPQVASLDGLVVEDDAPLLEVHNAFVMNFQVKTAVSPYAGSGRLDGAGIPSDFFSDIDVRRGFAHAFDYEAYLNDGYRGRGSRARGPIPKGTFGYDPGAPLTPFDLRKAEEHFRKAFKGKLWNEGFRIAVVYQNDRADRQLACQILKNGIEAVNPRFKVELVGILWSTYLSQFMAGSIPIVNTRWAGDYPDPHAFAYPLMHSTARWNRVTGYKNSRADSLIEAAAKESDSARRQALYSELQRIASQDLPIIFTLDANFLRLRRSWVKDWPYNPLVSSFYTVYKEW